MAQFFRELADGCGVARLQILLIDDDPHLLASFSAVYRKQPIDLYLAISGFDSFRILQERPVDVVIVDGNMPGLRGIEVLKIVKNRYPNILRVLLTGDPDPIARKGEAGEIHYRFTKPCDPVKLLESIQWARETEIPQCI